MNTYRKALLQIGSQHPAWSSNPEDNLVRIFNSVTTTARKAVNAVGKTDDSKADWCSRQLDLLKTQEKQQLDLLKTQEKQNG